MKEVGWIGTGVMGSSMAGHLLKAGYSVFVYNRTKQRAEGLLTQGARWCESPPEVASKADIVFSMVGHPADVEEIYLGENGILKSSECRARILVDMTSSSPTLAKRLALEAEKKGIACLDAPVSGGDIGAREAKLGIMVGGARKTFEEILPFLQVMGKTISYLGGHGCGQHTKLCNQILVTGTMISMCEALIYAAKIGLDQQAVIDIVGKGAAGSWSINNLGPRVAKGDFKPGFYIEHFIKDMGIALSEAAAMGICLPGLALVNQLYLAARAMGHGRSGTQALYLALKTINGMD